MGSRKKEPPLMTNSKTAIGIDLGSSKCCVGLVRDGNVEILENERGNKTTPSYVAFTEAERLVGESALDQVALNPTNTVFGAKRLLGRKGETPETIERLTKHFPYCVTQENGGVRIKVAYKGKEKKLSPEQITAMLLSQMKQLAEKHLGSPVLEAVIAVPAHFTNAQRRALKDAGTIAGLTVLGLISETTAAAVAYQDGKTFVKKQNVLVVDIGGGAFNAAVVEVQDSSIEVKAICGTPELSGNHLDWVLVDHMADRFTKLNKVDFKGNKKAFERQRIACQKAKHTLTLLPETVVQVDCLVGERDISDRVTRDEFNHKFLSAAQETIKKVLRNVLSDASLTPPEIDEVVLIGGTTRVPAVQEALAKFFSWKSLNKTVNPDEAVAHGAALQAAILVGDNSVTEVRVTDIVKNPVKNIPNLRSKFTVNQLLRIPRKGCNYSLIYFEYFPNYRCNNKTRLNHCLDSFGVYSPKGNQALIEDLKNTHVDVSNIQGYLTEEEVGSMTRQLDEFVKEDEEYQQLTSAVSDLEALCFNVNGKPTSEGEDKETVNDGVSSRSKALEFCDKTLDWLDLNELSSKKEYENRKENVEKLQNLFASDKDAMIDKTNSFSNDVNEQNAVQKGKATQEKVANGVKVVEQVLKTAPPDKALSNTLAGNEGVSQQKVSTLEVPPDSEYSNANSNHTKPSVSTSVSGVGKLLGCDKGILKVEVPVPATECKSTFVGMSIPVSIDGLLNEIPGETCIDSTHLQQGLQSSMLDYRDPTLEVVDMNEPEFEDPAPTTGIGVPQEVRDDAPCNDQNKNSVSPDVMEFMSQAIQNISQNSEVTDSVQDRGQKNAHFYSTKSSSELSKWTFHSNTHEISRGPQLRGVPVPQAVAAAARDGAGGQTVPSDDSEAMEVGASEHCILAGSEVMSNNVGSDKNVLQQYQNQRKSECSPPTSKGNIRQKSLPGISASGFAVYGQPTNLPVRTPHDVAHHSAGTSEQHRSLNNHQANLGINGQPTSSGTTDRQTPPTQLLPCSPSNKSGSSHEYPPFPPTSPQLRMSPPIITEDQTPSYKYALAMQMVQHYINCRYGVMRNCYLPCFFCFHSPYPINIHHFLMWWYQRLARCAVETCDAHSYLLYQPY